ncbi:porin-like protein [Yoonia maricola]|uniref:Porin-like protein n=1 Tax=Yoonia maricola TaxID=420999 RepID=A0A2M8W0U7_9RHOB|nr:porin [Yoonia maricola]PJI84551.1 porin-like protein [Yoonia maricola]
MKSTLLTTTALILLAGAPAVYADGHASVEFGGDFSLGFNDDGDDDNDEQIGDNDGFYWEGDLNITGTAALDNGVTAGVSLEFDLFDETNQQAIQSDGVLLSLTTDEAGLYLGETEFAAITQWSAAGDMEADGFSENDGENVLRGDVSFGGFDASVSYVLTHALGHEAGDNGFVDANIDGDELVAGGFGATDFDDFENEEEVDQLSIGLSGEVGMFSMSLAYQEESVSAGLAAIAAAANAEEGLTDDETDAVVAAGVYAPGVANGDFTENEIFGISAGVNLGGADITLAYAEKSAIDGEGGENSTGIQVAYPFGPVTATVYYVSEDDGSDEDNYGVTVAYADGPIAVTLDYDYDQGIDKTGLDASYDVGNGFTVLAGVFDQEDDGTDYYVAGTYDLGGGAELLVSYTDAETTDALADDEVGGPDYQVGTTVEVSFSF